MGRPSRVTSSPANDMPWRGRSGKLLSQGRKFSLRFYQKLKARPVIAPLAEVDIYDLRHYPSRYDIITIGPLSVRQFSGRKELLDNLTGTHGMTKEKAQILMNWVKTGGIVWIEFGIFIQRYELINQNDGESPSLPDLKGFTIFGLPTQSYVFEAKRLGALTLEPMLFTFANEAQHLVTSDIKALRLIQTDVKTIYPIISYVQGALIRERDKVYASAVELGLGKIISTLPFEDWDVEADGEKFRINLFEWLAGHPIPVFDPVLDIEQIKD